MKVSQLKVYSLGTVAANKKPSSMEIEVTPNEDSPMLDGELTDNADQYSAKATDKDGSAYHVEVATTNTIKATWLPLGSSNRLTSPDVRRGETVVLYRFADADKYYWTTLFNDMKLRKLETVIFAFSATKKEDEEAGPDSTYFFEISTHKKLIHLHTSRADGEPFGYDIQLNTGEGYLTITDDAGNFITLDSAENQIRFENVDGSIFDLNKKEITMFAVEKIMMEAKNINVKATDMTVDATTLHVTAKTTHDGDVAINGNLALKGNMTTSAGAGGDGSCVFSGDVTSTGTVHATKVVSDQAISAPNV